MRLRFVKIITLIISFVLWINPFYAQEKHWSLEDCIAHALTHNLSIQEKEIDKRLDQLNIAREKASFYPSLNISPGYNQNFGRSVNPTTNEFENTNYHYANISASTNVLVFGWFQKRYALQKTKLEASQNQQTYKQLQYDVALNISTAYLRVLMAKEEISNAVMQIEISNTQLERMRGLLDKGRSNKLEYAQTESQLQSDSGLYWQSQLNYEQSILELKALMNLDYATPLILDSLAITAIYFDEAVHPETVFQRSLSVYPSIQSANLAVQINEKDIKLRRAAALPQLNFSASSGSNYSSSFYEFSATGEQRLMSFGKQLNNNLSHGVGLNLSIPIFNGLSQSTMIKMAKLNHERSLIQLEVSTQNLKKEVYSAFNEYQSSLKKYDNAIKLLALSATSFEAASIRYEEGFISYFEFLIEKNNFLKSQMESVALKYDLYFKKILLERFMNWEG